MTQYSGRTTSIHHKGNDWESMDLIDEQPAIKQVTIFEVQWSDCPIEVENEVRKLWCDNELKNDGYYSWNRDDDIYFDVNDEEHRSLISERYPVIDEYLKSKNVTECLIHWWW